MSDIKQLNSEDLIQIANEIGLFDSNLTIKCVNCKALFPKDYYSCPQCKIEGSFHIKEF